MTAALATGVGKVAPAAAAIAPLPKPTQSDAIIKQYFAPDSFDEVPHETMRKTIARRLVEATTSIPHFYLTIECEIDALLKLRGELNAAAPKAKDGTPDYKLSVNDMIVKALALALVDVPNANVTFLENTMLRHHHADVAVAVAIPDGLITPVLKQADLLPLSVISKTMKDYTARAKQRRLKPSEYEGGVSAVSNLGMYGIKEFSAIINPPQSSILAVGAGEGRPVVRNGPDRSGDAHRRNAVLRPPRHRRRDRRATAGGLQAPYRNSADAVGHLAWLLLTMSSSLAVVPAAMSRRSVRRSLA